MMSTRQEIADAASFAWEQPAKKSVLVWPVLAIILLMVAHASFPLLVVRLFGR